MNILVTGSAGFVGRNLVENLKNIRDGKNRTRPAIHIEAIYEYDRNNTQEDLDPLLEPSVFIFQSSTWKLVIVAKMSACQRKQTDG